MKKKLIIFSIANGYGGAEKSIELLIKYLSRDFNIIVFASNNKHIESLKKFNVKVISLRIGNSLFLTIKNIVDILKVLYTETKDFDILVNTNKGAFYLSILSYFSIIRSKKIFIFIRDFQWKYQKFIFNSLRKYDPLYLFPSPAFLEKKSYFSKNITNYKIIPNIVEFDMCNNCEKYKKYFKEEKIILLPAMINRWKGIEYAIRAIKDIDNVKLYVIGKIVDQEYYKELKGLINKLGVQNKVDFIGYVDEICCFYKNCDLVLNTSISEFGGPETFGRTIIEAWHYEKPVIAFNCGGPKYLIKNSKNGFLVEEKNIKELSSKIKYVISNNLIDFNYKINSKENPINILKEELNKC